jgi:hypothetical protein
MIDASCPYQNERIRRQEQQQQEEAQNVNGNGTTTTSTTTTGGSVVVVHRQQMVLQTGPYRPLPLVTAMYHSLAIVFGNLTSRMEHMNVYSLVLLKFTWVLSLQLKTWRELRTMALVANNNNNVVLAYARSSFLVKRKFSPSRNHCNLSVYILHIFFLLLLV